MCLRPPSEVQERSIPRWVSYFTTSDFRKLTYTRFVDTLLRDQEWLNKGLQELYKRTQNCRCQCQSQTNCLPKGSPTDGVSTHGILQQLGIVDLAEQESSDTPMEDSSLTQPWFPVSGRVLPERDTSSFAFDDGQFNCLDKQQQQVSIDEIFTSPSISPDCEARPVFSHNTAAEDSSYFHLMPTQLNADNQLSHELQYWRELAFEYFEKPNMNDHSEFWKDFDFSALHADQIHSRSSDSFDNDLFSPSGAPPHYRL